MNEKKIQVAIPCYNEEATIGQVLIDFKKYLPEADLIVIDNNSADRTGEIARGYGAKVFVEKKQGKGHAVQKIFEVFEGDVLVLVDGDGTYDAGDVRRIVGPVIGGEAEMVVGNRILQSNSRAFSSSHWWGNKGLTKMLNFLFRTKLNDMESGYRAIDKKFVHSSALLAGGFGIEPEITIQALEKGFRIKEVPTKLEPRPEGSQSKLNTVRDGTVVLYTIISLFRDYRPLQFFSFIAGVFFLIGTGLAWYSIGDYIATGIVYHIPSLFVAGFFAIAGFGSFVAGLILSSIKRRHDELIVILSRSKIKYK